MIWNDIDLRISSLINEEQSMTVLEFIEILCLLLTFDNVLSMLQEFLTIAINLI